MKKELSQIYVRYKTQLLPALFILLSLFIVFRIIFPQLSEITGTNLTIENKKQELKILTDSIRVIENTNDSAISQDLLLSTNALPTSKDIIRIFSALTSAAGASNTELKEFSLKVGGVYGDKDSAVEQSAIGIPQLLVVAGISSPDSSSLINFAQRLSQTLPLSEIKKIEAASNLGTFDISFYYKPLNQNLISKNDKVEALSQADRELLNQLAEWNQN